MTTKADTSVKWFHSGMVDAPVLRGEAGALIELLDACLINGFGSRTADSIVVSGGVATVALGAGNPFEQHVVVKIEGATPVGLDAEWKIATSAASSFTFACPGIADGTATGTITVKRAAAGWGKPFSAANKAAYQSSDVGSTGYFLRLDDTDTQRCYVRGYEQMTDVDTGDEPFPTIIQRGATGYAWRRSNDTSTTSRPWLVVADGMMIYIVMKFDTTTSWGYALHWFGDVISYIPGDIFHCTIAAAGTPSPSYPGHAVSTACNRNAEFEYLARQADQLTKSPTFARLGFHAQTTTPWGLGMSSYTPGEPLNVMYPIPITDSGTDLSTTVPVRGNMPGLAAPLHHRPFSQLSIVDGGGALSGRKLIVAEVARDTSVGRLLIDITGPWR